MLASYFLLIASYFLHDSSILITTLFFLPIFNSIIPSIFPLNSSLLPLPYFCPFLPLLPHTPTPLLLHTSPHSSHRYQAIEYEVKRAEHRDVERNEKNDAYDAEIMTAKKAHSDGRERYRGVTCTVL